MSYTPSYSLLNTETFQKLNQLNATRSAHQVLTALNAYAMGENSCFPSLKTIQAYIGTSIGFNTISVALKWLRENGFIEQKHRTSKERFTMIFRRAVKVAKGVMTSIKEDLSPQRQDTTEDLSPQKNRRERIKKNKFINKKNKSSYYPRKSRISKKEIERREAQREQALKAEKEKHNSGSYAFGLLVIGGSMKRLSTTQKTNLIKSLENKKSEFYRWAQEQHPKLLEEIEKFRTSSSWLSSRSLEPPAPG